MVIKKYNPTDPLYVKFYSLQMYKTLNLSLYLGSLFGGKKESC